MTTKPKTIDEYISIFPAEIQSRLIKVLTIIKKVAPKAEETISYGIPTLRLNNTYLVYFAAYKNHIGIYPTPKGNEEFLKEIKPFRKGKGTLQFTYDKPLPTALIAKIIKFNLKANLSKAKKMGNSRKANGAKKQN